MGVRVIQISDACTNAEFASSTQPAQSGELWIGVLKVSPDEYGLSALCRNEVHRKLQRPMSKQHSTCTQYLNALASLRTALLVLNMLTSGTRTKLQASSSLRSFMILVPHTLNPTSMRPGGRAAPVKNSKINRIHIMFENTCARHDWCHTHALLHCADELSGLSVWCRPGRESGCNSSSQPVCRETHSRHDGRSRKT